MKQAVIGAVWSDVSEPECTIRTNAVDKDVQFTAHYMTAVIRAFIANSTVGNLRLHIPCEISFLVLSFWSSRRKKELDLGQRPPGCATSRLRPVNQLHFLPYANAIQWISPELSSVIKPTKFSWGSRDRKTTLCSKTPPFIFWIALSKINRFKYFWHVKFWVNLTWNSYRFVHLTCQM